LLQHTRHLYVAKAAPPAIDTLNKPTDKYCEQRPEVTKEAAFAKVYAQHPQLAMLKRMQNRPA
jgi:hypothetical protein